MSKRKRLPNSDNNYKIYYWITGVILFLSVLFLYRTSITMYYYIIKERFEERELGYYHLEQRRTVTEAAKIENTIQKYRSNVFGIDISQHQGNIKWDSLQNIKQSLAVSFVFIRATRGPFVEDAFFKRNWKYAKKKNIIRGAYHYYDVNKNSTEQAQNFIKTVTLEKGDLPPVLDIEDLPKNQSLDLLKKGLINWLNIVEKKYNVKPIIYSNDAYFIHHIHNLNLDAYPIWVANYNPIKKPSHTRWSFWQFTDQGIIKGITQNYVDLNIFNGNISQLKKLTIK